MAGWIQELEWFWRLSMNGKRKSACGAHSYLFGQSRRGQGKGGPGYRPDNAAMVDQCGRSLGVSSGSAVLLMDGRERVGQKTPKSASLAKPVVWEQAQISPDRAASSTLLFLRGISRPFLRQPQRTQFPGLFRTRRVFGLDYLLRSSVAPLGRFEGRLDPLPHPA